VSRDDARRFLIKGSGTHFDRQIVDVFLRNLQKLEAEAAAQGLFYNSNQENAVAETPIVFDEDSDQSYVKQIKRANREVYTLYELARIFSSSVNLEETLSLFVQKIGELVPFDTCVIYLMDESDNFATAAYIQGENKSLLKNKRIKVGEGATGFVLKKHQSVYGIKPSLDFVFSDSKPSRDYTAMVSLPLTGNQKMLGAVSLYSYDLKDYKEEHLRLLETVARIASDAMGMSLQHAASETRSLTDPMTGLPNARSLQLQFEKEMARAGRHGSNFQVLMLDLDGFKAVNDTFGHNVGDKLLKEIAGVMRGQLRDYDFLARYAGDEFVAVVPETGTREILELCGRIEKAVFNFILPVGSGQSAQVGVSIGAACYPKHGDTLDQVIASADKAMYAAKADRKARRLAEFDCLIGEILQTESFTESKFVVELDESHIISSAIN
ncbi:MAG: sensor domain-containing diguanylate cyclase, partial [Acidobacteriota bacterium]|nr:sensor domain-containing diguanylate cyclase [Acidobacteriota bacterium]